MDRSRKKVPPKDLINGIFIGVLFGLTSIITVFMQSHTPGDVLTTLFPLILPDSLRYALWGMVLSLLLANNDGTIHCTEVISWSWKRLFISFKSRNSFYNLLIGLGMGFVFGGKGLFQGHLSSV